MVSSISSSLLLTQQAALKALQSSNSSTSGSSTTSATGTASGSLVSSELDDMPSLVDILSSGDDDDDSDDDASIFQALISSVQQQISSLQGTTSTDTTSTDSASDDGDITTSSFMSSLKDRIEAMQQSQDTAAMGDDMMTALENGTLTVTDPTSGEEITAWDPDDSDATASQATPVDETDWSSFLKDHLARANDGKYVRNDDGSHQDKQTGDSAYFGMVNDNYVYMTWTDASSTGSTSTDS